MTTGAPRRLGKFLGWALAGCGGRGGRRVSRRVVRHLQCRRQPRPLGRRRLVPGFRHAQFGGAARHGDHAAAARQPRPHQARGGPLSRRLRFLSRRARHSRQSDRAPHAALAARSHDIDASVEGRRAVLDRPARHQIHGHAGLGGAGARRRDLGRRGLPETHSDHRCGELSARSRSAAFAYPARPARSSPPSNPIRRVPARARAAMAPRAAGRPVRWCRSSTASLPSS